jgi:hypothetical protein
VLTASIAFLTAASMALQGARDESPTVNPHAIQSDLTLLSTSTRGPGTDEIAFLSLFLTRSSSHLFALSSAYPSSPQARHKSLADLIKAEFSGHMRDGLLFIARGYEAGGREKRAAEMLEESMKGMGTKDERLIWRVVRGHWTRGFGEWEGTKRAYRGIYGKELVDRIHGDTSGDYRVSFCFVDLSSSKASKDPSEEGTGDESDEANSRHVCLVLPETAQSSLLIIANSAALRFSPLLAFFLSFSLLYGMGLYDNRYLLVSISLLAFLSCLTLDLMQADTHRTTPIIMSKSSPTRLQRYNRLVFPPFLMPDSIYFLILFLNLSMTTSSVAISGFPPAPPPPFCLFVCLLGKGGRPWASRLACMSASWSDWSRWFGR